MADFIEVHESSSGEAHLVNLELVQSISRSNVQPGCWICFLDASETGYQICVREDYAELYAAVRARKA